MKSVHRTIVVGMGIFGLMGLIGGCTYSPTAITTQQKNTAELFAINSGVQICNPSISQNDAYFPACMMFLNLGERLNVNVKSADASYYPLTPEFMHDRITIIDTSNTVKWYMFRTAPMKAEEFQDPEWSTHPNYLAFCKKEGALWDGYIGRISDKTVLKFNSAKMNGNSTPHAWIDEDSVPSPAPIDTHVTTIYPVTDPYDAIDGMVSKATIHSFFGTNSVVISFSKNVAGVQTLFYIDYRDSVPKLTALVRPTTGNASDDASYLCGDGLILKGGKWIVYNFRFGTSSTTYFQRLAAGSEPFLISKKAADPHWWQYPDGSNAVVYSTFISGGPLFTPYSPEVANGSLGQTMIQRVLVPVDTFSHPGWTVLYGQSSVLAELPFHGGLDRMGNYLCTGYAYAYLNILR